MIANMQILLRRELWEHKALYVTPFVVAALIVFGFVLSFLTMVFTGVSFKGAVAALELTGAPAGLAGGAALIGVPFGVLYVALAAVIFFYCIDALYAERQDKSILFWRSLPVTDTETVLSKFLTAAVLAPLLTALVMVATQVLLLLLASIAIFLGSGNPVELLLSPLPFVQLWVLFTYLLVTSALWFAPVIGWFLLCSAFAKRSVLIWVVVPWLVLMMLEGIVLRQGRIAGVISRRFSGGYEHALEFPGISDIGTIDEDAVIDMVRNGTINVFDAIAPGKYLMSAGLWSGLVVAALFIAAAIYCRRFRS